MVNRNHKVPIIHDILKKQLLGIETAFSITSSSWCGKGQLVFNHA
jgi:hypothetical protein